MTRAKIQNPHLGDCGLNFSLQLHFDLDKFPPTISSNASQPTYENKVLHHLGPKLGSINIMTTKANPSTTLLARAHSPTTATQIYTERIKTKPLLLRPSSPDPLTNARSLRRQARQQKDLLARRGRKKNRKPQPLSAAQKRRLCLYDIPKNQRKYAIYEPLHEMWCGYVREILGLGDGGGGQVRGHVTPASAGPMLTSADFHGAMVEVVRSRCVGRVGLRGIVVKDTKFTFEVVTKKNEIKSECTACRLLMICMKS